MSSWYQLSCPTGKPPNPSVCGVCACACAHVCGHFDVSVVSLSKKLYSYYSSIPSCLNEDPVACYKLGKQMPCVVYVCSGSVHGLSCDLYLDQFDTFSRVAHVIQHFHHTWCAVVFVVTMLIPK